MEEIISPSETPHRSIYAIWAQEGRTSSFLRTIWYCNWMEFGICHNMSFSSQDALHKHTEVKIEEVVSCRMDQLHPTSRSGRACVHTTNLVRLVQKVGSNLLHIGIPCGCEEKGLSFGPVLSKISSFICLWHSCDLSMLHSKVWDWNSKVAAKISSDVKTASKETKVMEDVKNGPESEGSKKHWVSRTS